MVKVLKDALTELNQFLDKKRTYARLLECDMTSEKALQEYLDEEIRRMLEKKLLTDAMEQLVQRKKIIEFLQSPIAHRMAEADKRGDLYNEKPFVMDYDGVLVQGIIDVFWMEEGRIVLMDYKTDRVALAQELLDRYATQLRLYAQALSKVFGKPHQTQMITENLIYSFALGEVISVSNE